MTNNDAQGVSDADKALYKALASFQANCPPIVKDKTARIKTDKGSSYEYRYADLGAVVSTVRKAMSDAGLSHSQTIRTIDGKLKLQTKIFHVDGGFIESDMDLPNGNVKPQELGSLLTYYRRYMLTSALGIAAEDDDDGMVAQSAASSGSPVKHPGSMPESELSRIRGLIDSAGSYDALKKIVNDGMATAHRFGSDSAHEQIRAAANARLEELKKAAAGQKPQHDGVPQ